MVLDLPLFHSVINNNTVEYDENFGDGDHCSSVECCHGGRGKRGKQSSSSHTQSAQGPEFKA